MSDLLEQYKEGLHAGPQEIVALNKAGLVKILKDISFDVNSAYEDRGNTSNVAQYLQRLNGRVNTLLTLLGEK